MESVIKAEDWIYVVVRCCNSNRYSMSNSMQVANERHEAFLVPAQSNIETCLLDLQYLFRCT
jgi:hypothetical protein